MQPVYANTGQSANPDTVFHPNQQSGKDNRDTFALAVLRESLANVQANKRLQPSPFVTQQNRALRLLDKGELDVVWTATTIQREKRYRAITIPIYQGLLGWRIALIKASDADILSDKPTLDAMRNFIIGAGGSWPEVGIYSQNGFTLQTATTYDGLFDMLSMGRFDLFPRSIIEIHDELEQFGELGLIADPHVLIRYPYALYFFVRENNVELATQIEQGMVKLFESGRYHVLFEHMVGSRFAELALQTRHVIHLPNTSFAEPAPKYQKYFRE